MKTIQLKDFLGFSYLSDVLMSKDGSHAAYLRHQCDAEADGYVSQLWLTSLADAGNQICSGAKKPVFAWESGETLFYCFLENV